jgi:hypothetical protein
LLGAKFRVSRNDCHLGDPKHCALHRRWSLADYNVKTKPGMSDDYLKALAKIFKSTNDEARKQGIITDYKILVGDASTQQDYDILLMIEYPNMAALDGLRDKTDAIGAKLVGTEDQQRQLAVKRLEIREIMGDKLMREVMLK